MNQTEQLNPLDVTEVEQVIRTAFNEIRDGSIEILTHDSKVVQIKRKERLRFAFDRLRDSR